MKKMIGLAVLSLLAGVMACSGKAVKAQAQVQVAEKDTAVIIAETVVSNSGKIPGMTVAIVDFTDIDGQETEAGKILSEQIVTCLVSGGQVKVAEREKLNRILDEQKLSLAGLTDEKDDTQEKLVNADGIVTGTILDRDGEEEINARLISVKSGEILGAVSVKRSRRNMLEASSGLTADQKDRLEKENRALETIKNKDPKRYEVNQDVKEEMKDLSAKDPQKFRKTLSLVRTLEKVRVERPGVYLLLTEPDGSKYLQQLKSNKPEEFRKINNARKGIVYIIGNVPSFREKIIFDRVDALQRFKRK